MEVHRYHELFRKKFPKTVWDVRKKFPNSFWDVRKKFPKKVMNVLKIFVINCITKTFFVNFLGFFQRKTLDYDTNLFCELFGFFPSEKT